MNIKETRRQFMVYNDGIAHIELEEENHMLDEVLIVSGRVQNVKSVQLGMEKFQPALLKNIPTAMGEVDVLKMIQTLPGIKAVARHPAAITCAEVLPTRTCCCLTTEPFIIPTISSAFSRLSTRI